MYYHLLYLECDNTDQDILIALLSHLPFESFEYVDNGVKAYIKSEHYNPGLVLNCLRAVKAFKCKIKWLELEEKNWNNIWESNFQPVEIGKFCRIMAPFHEQKKGYDFEIVINPEMAFGTGHHETTYMMIQAMKKLDFKGKRILDFGCGTGILAILASGSGAFRVDAVDNDEKAIRNTIANCSRNNILNVTTSHSTPDIIDKNDFDLILANINKNVLKQYVLRLLKILVPRGKIILSGILVSDFPEMRKLYLESGFVLIDSMQKGEWKCLSFYKADQVVI